jgi:hypothetical protein
VVGSKHPRRLRGRVARAHTVCYPPSDSQLRMNFQKVTVCLVAAALLSSCGSPGVPLPPSLELAKPVTDLHAVRKGDKVYLTWTAPILTTDRHNIRHFGATQICRSLGATMDQCRSPVSTVAPATLSKSKKVPAAQQVTASDELPAMLQSANTTGSLVYAVNVLNSYGRSAGLSNQVLVPAAPTLPPPGDFHAELTADGVRLAWTPISSVPAIPGLRFSYRVYRREQGSKTEAVAGEIPIGAESAAILLDRSMEWEKTYEYHATVVTLVAQANDGEQRVEGDNTPPLTVVADDVFPPAVPTGLQAVFSGPGQKLFIDLVWTPNSDPDLAGYNIYRHEQGVAPERVNSELARAPAFRDLQVLSGHQYSYSISAVDVRGNESQHSDEASETVP